MYYRFLALMNAPAHDTTAYLKSWTAVFLAPLIGATLVYILFRIFLKFPTASGFGGILLMCWAVLLFVVVGAALLMFTWGMLTNMEPLKLRVPESVRRLEAQYKDRALQDSNGGQSQTEESSPR